MCANRSISQTMGIARCAYPISRPILKIPLSGQIRIYALADNGYSTGNAPSILVMRDRTNDKWQKQTIDVMISIFSLWHIFMTTRCIFFIWDCDFPMFRAILQNIYITFDEQIVQRNRYMRRIIREKKIIMKLQLYFHNIKSGWKSSVALIYSGIRDIPISIIVLWACFVYIFSAFNACDVYPQQTVKIYCAKNVLNSIVRHTYRNFEISMKSCIPKVKSI